LCDESEATIPEIVLIPYESDFDILFANQVAVLNAIEEGVRHSPVAWLRSCFARSPKKWSRRVALCYRKVDPTAEIHPTAIVEGCIIGPRAQVGAHAVVRFSSVGADTKLYDGAKVEFSVVGARCWLMHDLVLYRSHVEDDVFLIHGPYQFSGFQSKSSAFATILMDYRPDRKPIRVETPQGRREYQGPFLGSILREGAKTLGGSLIAPGLIIPKDRWLSVDSQFVQRQPSS
jgi:NDP-sugar pyrophosphorylase family protein